MIILSIVFVVLSSYIFIDDNMPHRNWIIKIILSYWFSLSILSILFDLFLFTKIDYLVFLTTVTLLPMFFLAKQRDRLGQIWMRVKNYSLPDNIYTLVLSIGILIYSIIFYGFTKKWGDWDAWAIWNLHAKFLSYSSFSNLFTNEIAWTHPDYPLMLPSINAMIWKSFGVQSPVVPAIVAFVTGLSLILLIVNGLYEKGLKIYAIIGMIIFTCPIISFSFVSSQYADVMLGVFILISALLMNGDSKTDKSPLTFILIGFFTASAAWIKNEGTVFFLVFSMVFFVSQVKSFKRILYYGSGTLLPLLVVVIFKIVYAPTNDLLKDQSGDITAVIFDISRYITIIKYFVEYLLRDVQILYFLLIGLLLVNRKFYISINFIIVLMVLGAYFIVYVITPHDLKWHMSNSFDRLVMHLMPTLVYTCLLYYGKKLPLSDWAVGKK